MKRIYKLQENVHLQYTEAPVSTSHMVAHLKVPKQSLVYSHFNQDVGPIEKFQTQPCLVLPAEPSKGRTIRLPIGTKESEDAYLAWTPIYVWHS